MTVAACFERLLQILRQQADDIRRIADSLDQSQPELVNTRYLANRLGLTTQWVGQMIRDGQIPRNCVASGGDGRQWKLYRQKIEEWLERDRA